MVQVEQSLPTDERGIYVASLTSPHTKVTSPPCMITGKQLIMRSKGRWRGGGEGGEEERFSGIMGLPASFLRLSCAKAEGRV